MAHAVRVGGSWHVGAPAPVAATAAFVDGLFARDTAGPLLCGFDMPLGLPLAWGERTGLPGFRAALPALGRAPWARFYEPADTRHDIGLARPFYPARPGRKGTVSHRDLAAGHGVAQIGDLLRRCERAGGTARPATPLFWTLGAAAVGKAAMHGWQAVIAPAVARGASLWPFDGDLAALATGKRPVLAETYPADVYARLGLSFSGRSKTRQADRLALATPLRHWMAARATLPSSALEAALASGFDATFGSDDGFDAVVGLLGMIGVVSGERAAGAPDDAVVRGWEGWILGRLA